MNLEELKVNRYLYKGNTMPMAESSVNESSTINPGKKIGAGGRQSANAKEVESGTVISSCFVRTSERETRVELVPFSFDTSGADVFGEQTYIDALIAWRGVNDPAVVIDQYGILVTHLFVSEDFTILGGVDIIGPINYQGSVLPLVYNGLIGGGADFLPTSWSSSHPSTGTYTITHNFGNSQYTILLTCGEGAGAIRIPIVTSIGTNSFTFVVKNAADVLTDTATFFSVMIAP